MKTKVVFFSLLLVSFLSLTAQETRFVQYPDIRGDRLVFTYEGDLWTAGLDGSPALRITSHPGMEFSPKFSPDGKWIASASGGEIRLWPMPDLSKPPLHTLPHDELLAKLRALTNLQVVEDAASPTGYKLDIGPFPGWKDVPTW